jgi:hypothetical protein
MLCDRGHLWVTVADKNTLRSLWNLPPEPVEYNATSIRELLVGVDQKLIDFSEQKEFVRANWNAIVAMFSPEHRQATHQRLSFLGRERLKRAIKPWPQVITSFEAFLKGLGFICENREASDGALGDRLMQYTDEAVMVKIASAGGWQLTIADKVNRPDDWYDIRTFRRMLLPDLKSKFPFTEWFPFAQANWDAIVGLFAPTSQKDSHQLLQPLEKEVRANIQLFRDQQKTKMEELFKKMDPKPPA